MSNLPPHSVPVLIPCQFCGTGFSAAKEQCPSCKKWRSTAEAKIDGDNDETMPLSDVKNEDKARLYAGALSPMFGGCDFLEENGKDTVKRTVVASTGGIALGSVNLLGGAPGAGKSTLGLQLASWISNLSLRETLYVAKEQRAEEIKARVDMLNLPCLNLVRLYPMHANTNLRSIVMARKPAAIIVDSLTAVTRDPRERLQFLAVLKGWASILKSPAIVIDHINKRDDFAGLMDDQHEVDMLASLFSTGEGEEREMEVHKNRNGPANISMFFTMTERGLIPKNPPKGIKHAIHFPVGQGDPKLVNQFSVPFVLDKTSI